MDRSYVTPEELLVILLNTVQIRRRCIQVCAKSLKRTVAKKVKALLSSSSDILCVSVLRATQWDMS